MPDRNQSGEKAGGEELLRYQLSTLLEGQKEINRQVRQLEIDDATLKAEIRHIANRISQNWGIVTLIISSILSIIASLIVASLSHAK